MRFAFTCRNNAALHERIPGETFHARADRHVVQHVTLSVDPARARTRVRAPLIDAREMTLALGAQDALWPTLRWYTDVIRQAGARGITGYYLTQRVRAARRWSARWRPLGYREVFWN